MEFQAVQFRIVSVAITEFKRHAAEQADSNFLCVLCLMQRILARSINDIFRNGRFL